MNKFWKWMIVTGKGNSFDGEKWIYDDFGTNCGWVRQAIIGFMIQYLIETDGGVCLNIHTNIDDLYFWLEKKITENVGE